MIVEFEAQAKNGIIKIPSRYNNFKNAFLRIRIEPEVKMDRQYYNLKLVRKNS